MCSTRVIAILFLFIAAGAVLVFVGIQWITEFHALSAATNPGSYILLLLTLATFFLAGMCGMHFLARRLLIWALRSQHLAVILFFQHIAPKFTRNVLGSLLGTSIALSTSIAASATPVAPMDSQASVQSADKNVQPERTGVEYQSVPNAQWFPEQVSVPMNNLISPKTPPKRESARTGTEVVVAEGDSLWSICAKHLGPQATVEEIATYWPQIYKANERAIGANPDQLMPGTVIELPPTR